MELKALRISEKREEQLVSMGIHTVEELLSYYPFRYEVFKERALSEWQINDTVTCEATILSRPHVMRLGGKRSMTRFAVQVQDQEFQAVLFNRPWTSQFQPGRVMTLSGKYQGKGRITVANYQMKPLSELEGIYPVYSLKEGMHQKDLRRLIEKAMSLCLGQMEDVLPRPLRKRYRLCSRAQAVRWIHAPRSREEIKQALRHLKYEEFFRFQLIMQALREENRAYATGSAKQFSADEVFSLEKTLPFQLTDDQRTAIAEILDDLASERLMYRMLQGDVGCGKTMVAAFGLYACVLAHRQGAFLAPTEILARQHAESLKALFADTGIRVELLCASLKPAVRKQVLSDLAEDQIDIVVGTHALFQDEVKFYDLGMVVADEQQRFGVQQRRRLLEKGEKVDFLLMSATPIPRTLAQSLFGDMDVSIIAHRPSGRMPVTTHLVRSSSMGPILEEVLQKIDEGNQCYVVCPAIEKNEEMPMRNVTDIYQGMCSLLGKRYRIGLLHGKMSGEEKNEVMERFVRGELDILVSTTVIEVGIDVKKANLMVIYDAHRFGLSTIHQLRGRVGRGSQPGYCYLLTSSGDEEALQRMKMLETLSDGFEISRYDLSLRGPGDLLGTRQSGVPGFVLGNVITDEKMMEAARSDAAYALQHLEDEEYACLKPIIEQDVKKSAYFD